MSCSKTGERRKHSANRTMVDVDRRMSALGPAHSAGLRRLSVRAATAYATSTTTHRLGVLSLRPLAEVILSHLHAASVPLRPGLSEPELARLEADLAFCFPPDFRALLALALPSGPGFPDWRAPGPGHLLRLPRSAAALQVARGSLWPHSWGSRPADPARALRRARAALRRASLLIPLFGRCYLPCFPCLAGNPVFYVDDSRIFCCAIDIIDFFQCRSPFSPYPSCSSALPSLEAARWIEFWSDAASDHRRRISSSSSSSTSCSYSSSPPPDPVRFVEIRTPRLPDWVGCYLDGIGSALRQGGWGESDVQEMVHVPVSSLFDAGDERVARANILVDPEAALDALLVKAGRCSDSLQQAGWSPKDVSDALGIEHPRRKGRRQRSTVEVPPAIALRVEELAQAVARS